MSPKKQKDKMASSNSSAHSNPIKTVVVLVQENRSFDHMLGWMKSLNPEINGVTGTESNPLPTSSSSTSNNHNIFFRDNSVYVDPDPGHSIQDIYEQVFGVPWSSTQNDNVSSKKSPTRGGGSSWLPKFPCILSIKLCSNS